MAKANVYESAKSAIRRVVENKTFRGVALIGGGTAVGQAIMVAATPIVSRLYGPHAYGAFAIFSSILGIASCFVSFRFESAIPLPEQDEEARDLLVLSLTLALLFVGVTGLAFLVWHMFTKANSHGPLFGLLAWTLPLGMLSIGCYDSLGYWAIRKRLYRNISAYRVNQSIASVGTQIILHRLPPLGLGLILAYTVGQAFGLRPLFLAFRNSSPKVPLPSMARLVSIGRKYWNLSVYGSATAIITNIGDSLPSLLLAKAFGLDMAGIYLMAYRVFSLPTQMVGGAVSQVFTGEASERLRKDPRLVLDYFHSVHRNMRWIGGVILVLGAISPLVLPWVLGANWHAAGVAAAILAPMAAADITVRPLYNITVIGNRPKLQLLTGVLPMGLSFIGLGFPILLGFTPRTTLIAYSLCRCLGCGLIYIIYRHVAKTIKSNTVNETENAITI